MTSASSLIKWATAELVNAQCASPENDARLLLAFVLDIERQQIDQLSELTTKHVDTFKNLIAQRAKRIPLQHLTGKAYFRYLELSVGPGVFIPRPETELLVETGLAKLAEISGPKLAIDLCSGSGAIALSLALESAETTVHAVELSKDAFTWLEKNVAAHAQQLARLNSTVITYCADATSRNVLSHLAGTADVVLSNPPYIPSDMVPREPEVRDFDPAIALYGGSDGLAVARKVSLVAADLLKPQGLFGMEHADVQGESVVQLLNEMTANSNPIWSQVADQVDYNELPRFVTALRTTADSLGEQ